MTIFRTLNSGPIFVTLKVMSKNTQDIEQIVKDWEAFKRGAFHTLLKRVQEPRRFKQVLAGPRQTGKSATISEKLLLIIQEIISWNILPAAFFHRQLAIFHYHPSPEHG